MGDSAFQHLIKVSQNDIDELGHINNVVYVRYVQEVAAAHWSFVANTQLRSKLLWVVLRHEIDYKSPGFVDDTVIGTTWVGNHRGPRFERYVKLTSQTNRKVLAEAKTIWCLVDARTMKPLRITEELANLFKG